MQQNVFHQPNKDALNRILLTEYASATGVILRLAWLEGLTRDEISSLTWEQIDFDANELRLPERTVPLDGDAARCLLAWRTLCGEYGPYVVVSEQRRARLTPQSISRLARTALDAQGQEKVRLLDLRYDFVLRQLETHDWPYVLRISGLSVTTYRNSLADLRKNDPVPERTPRDAQDEEFRIWKIMQAEQNTPPGIALWLSHQIGLQNEAIVALTWEQVDFDANVIRLPDGDEPMTNAVGRILKAEKQRRAPDDDPHVILTPRTKKPLTVARLSTMVRTILIRGGVENQSLRDLRRDAARESEHRLLLDYVREHGSISRGEAMALLDMSANKVYSRLNALTFSGELVRINSRYYPAGEVVLPGQQADAIKRYLAESGPAYCQDIAALLHIGKRTTARILKKMVDSGELILLRREKRYTLLNNAADHTAELTS